MQAADEKAYSFAGFTVDLRQARLRTGEREIELRPKSFALLCHLLENAGRLVPKDELVQAIWPNVFVTDDSLTRCVSDVRLATSPDPAAPSAGVDRAASQTVSRPQCDAVVSRLSSLSLTAAPWPSEATMFWVMR